MFITDDGLNILYQIHLEEGLLNVLVDGSAFLSDGKISGKTSDVNDDGEIDPGGIIRWITPDGVYPFKGSIGWKNHGVIPHVFK